MVFGTCVGVRHVTGKDSLEGVIKNGAVSVPVLAANQF